MLRLKPFPLVLLAACVGGSKSDSDVLANCPVPTGGPTLHDREMIETDVTWAADAGPHVIEGQVQVSAGATLTIEPCAEVRLGADAYLDVLDGKLTAEGTAEAPILFTRDGEDAWAYVEIMAPATASLSNVFLRGGGSEYPNGGYSTLLVRGPFEGRSTEMLTLNALTIEDSYGPGLWMREDAAFTVGSTGLMVTSSGEGDGSDPSFAYPVITGVYGLTNLPETTLAGNVTDAVLIDANDIGGGYSGFLDDVTIHDRGVPYHVGTSEADGTLRPSDANDGAPVTLTLEAGVTLQFTEFGKILLWTDDSGSGGILRSMGTAEKPVLLTSTAASPSAGAWVGIEYQGTDDEDLQSDPIHPDNLIQHTIIEFAGGDCSCGGYACDLEENNGAVLFHSALPGSVFLTDSTIRASAGHAFVRGWTGGPLDFAGANTLEDIAGCAQTSPFDEGGYCVSSTCE